jgi:hypothetical protein
MLPFVIIVVAAGIGAALWEFLVRRRRRLAFADRIDMSMDSLFEQYFASTGVQKSVVEHALAEIANAIDLPVGKLRPTDRFERELAPAQGWEYDDGIGIVAALAEKRLSGLPPDVRPRIETVEDFVRLAARVENAGSS